MTSGPEPVSANMREDAGKDLRKLYRLAWIITILEVLAVLITPAASHAAFLEKLESVVTAIMPVWASLAAFYVAVQIEEVKYARLAKLLIFGFLFLALSDLAISLQLLFKHTA
jgi:hypothetical protein